MICFENKGFHTDTELALWFSCYGPALASAMVGRSEAWLRKRLQSDPDFRSLCERQADQIETQGSKIHCYYYKPRRPRT